MLAIHKNKLRFLFPYLYQNRVEKIMSRFHSFSRYLSKLTMFQVFIENFMCRCLHTYIIFTVIYCAPVHMKERHKYKFRYVPFLVLKEHVRRKQCQCTQDSEDREIQTKC